MPSTSKLLVENLRPATLFFLKKWLGIYLTVMDYRIWRHRRTHKFSIIGAESCIHSTSFLFQIRSEEIVQVAKSLLTNNDLSLTEDEKTFLNNLKEQDLHGQTITTLLPLERFRKEVLIDYKIFDARNTSLSLVSRLWLATLGYEVFAIYCRSIKKEIENTGGNLKEITEFLKSCDGVIKALIYSFPSEIRAFKNFMTGNCQNDDSYEFLKSRLLGLGHDLSIAFNQDSLKKVINLSNDFVGALIKKLTKETLFQNDFRVMFNPLLLIHEYFIIKGLYHSSNLSNEIVEKNINDFLNECIMFLEILTKIIAHQDMTEKVLENFIQIIDTATSTYVGFLEIDVCVDSQLLIRSEKLIGCKIMKSEKYEAGSDWAKYRGFEMNIEQERSWHLGISSPSPSEISIDPTQIFLVVGEEKIKPNRNMWVQSEIGEESVSLYQNISWSVFEEKLKKEGEDKLKKERKKISAGAKQEITLWVKFSVNPIIKWVQVIGVGVVLVISSIVGYLIYLKFTEEKFNITNDVSIHSTVILLLSTLIFFAITAREKHPFTSSLIQKTRSLIFWLGLGTAFVVFLLMAWEFVQPLL